MYKLSIIKDFNLIEILLHMQYFRRQCSQALSKSIWENSRFSNMASVKRKNNKVNTAAVKEE